MIQRPSPITWRMWGAGWRRSSTAHHSFCWLERQQLDSTVVEERAQVGPVLGKHDRSHVVNAWGDPEALRAGVRIVDTSNDGLRHPRIQTIHDGEKGSVDPRGGGHGVHIVGVEPSAPL